MSAKLKTVHLLFSGLMIDKIFQKQYLEITFIYINGFLHNVFPLFKMTKPVHPAKGAMSHYYSIFFKG